MPLSPRRLIANLGALTVGRVLTLCLSTITLALVARHLGQFRYGQLALAIAYTIIVAMIADAGISFIAPRDLARIDDAKLRCEMAGSMVALSTCLFIAVSAIAELVALMVLPGALMSTAVAILLAGGLFTPLLSIGTALAAAAHRQHVVAVAHVAGGLVTLATVLVVDATGARAAVIAVAYASATAVSGGALILGAHGGALRPRFALNEWRATLAESLPMLAAGGINTLYGKADILLLALLTTSVQVGRYGLAYKVADAVIGVPGLLVLVLQPIMVRAQAMRARFDDVVENAMLGAVVVVIPIVAMIVCFARAVGLVLGGHGFKHISGAIVILAFAAGLTFPTAILSAGLVTLGRQRALIATTTVALVTNVCANLALIPVLSIAGAAWALLISEAVVLIAFGLIYQRYARIPYPQHGLALTISTTVMLVVALVGPRVLNIGTVGDLLVWGTVSTLAYGAILWKIALPQAIVGVLTAEERRDGPPGATDVASVRRKA